MHDTRIAGFGFVSGTTTNGLWQARITVPEHAAPGEWAYVAVASDGSGNQLAFYNDQGGAQQNLPPYAAPPLRVGMRPETMLTSGPASATNARTATLRFSSDTRSVTYQCQLDGAPWEACTSPKSYAELGDGTHQFRVRAIDSAGHIDGTPAIRTFVVDTAAPDTTIEDGPGEHGAPTFSFSSSEPGSSFACRVDGGAYSACDPPVTLDGLSDGRHTFAVRAIDAAGNVDTSAAARAFTVGD